MSAKSKELKVHDYFAGDKIITFNEPLIMAIVNLTPDSFYDGGKYHGASEVIRDVAEKIENGAHIIDLGAASTRPNALEINEKDEWERLQPTLAALRTEFPKILISVDTFRAEIAKRAAAEGADIINDIGGGDLDPKMFNTIAALQIPYVLMHIQGTPKTMQVDPIYENVAQEVRSHLSERIQQLELLGFTKIIVDPGFGFGKTLQHNYQLLRQLNLIKELGYPVLAGVSRKGMIHKVIGANPVTALNGTTVINTIALLQGASILRVHDVVEAKQTIELVQFYKNVPYE